MKSLARSFVWWPRMNKDLEAKVRALQSRPLWLNSVNAPMGLATKAIVQANTELIPSRTAP